MNGLEDRRRAAMQSVSFDARFRLFNRDHAPFGLTLSIAPAWGFRDDLSGAPAEQYGSKFLLIADRELLPNRLFGALNISYEPVQTRLRPSGETLQDATLGMSMAVAVQFMPGVFIGGEVRHLRRYGGLGLEHFVGQALYAGPTLYATFGNNWWLSAAWNVQAWGMTSGNGALDLTNFERHQARLRLGVIF